MRSRFICLSLTFTAADSQNRVRVQTTGVRVIVKGESAQAAPCVLLAKRQTNDGNDWGRMDLILEF